MELAIALLSAINAATPGALQLIQIIREKDGKVTVIQFLDQADLNVDKNAAQLADWFTKKSNK